MLDHAWPYLDRYTVRTAGLLTAQQRVMSWDPHVAVGPAEPGERLRDESYTTASWGPDHQRRLGPATGSLRWEQPDLGFAPVTAKAVRDDLEEVVRSLRPVIVHVHGPHQLARAALDVAVPQLLPVVYEPRGEMGGAGSRSPEARALSRARRRRVTDLTVSAASEAGAVVAISDAEAQALTGAGVPEERIHLVPDAVDTTHFVPGQPREPDGTLHIGAFVPTSAAVEAADPLLAELARARADGVPVRATLAGGGEDTDLATLVDAHGLSDAVVLPGTVTLGRAPAMLRSLDLFVVLPRGQAAERWTPSPGALEALACGVPVVAPDEDAVRARLADHDGVTLLELDDADRVAAYLASAAAAPPERPSGDVGTDSWAHRVTCYVDVYAAAGAPAGA